MHVLLSGLNIIAALYLAMALYGLVRPPSVSNRLLVLVTLICAGWAATYYQELAAPCFEAKLAWMRARFVFIPFLTVLWAMLSADLAGVRTKVPSWVWALCFVVPTLSVPLGLTVQYHALYRHGFALAGHSGLQPLLFQRGPWCRVYDLHSLGLQLASLYLIAKAWRNAAPPLRWPIPLLFFSSLLPIVGNAIFNVRPLVAGGLNPALPLLFPSVVALAVAVFRSDLLAVAPIARDMLFDHIHDGILVVDALGRVADLNTAAARMLGVPVQSLKNRALDAAPSPWPACLGTADAATLTFQSTLDSPGRWYERTRHPIERDGRLQGWMFVVEDVTDRTAMEAQRIQEARAEEEAKRTRQWRLLLRDLHDGIGGISANIAMLASLARKTPDYDAKDEILSQIGDLANEGNIEVRTMMNSLEARDMSWPDLFAEVRRFAALVLEPRGILFALRVEGTPGPPPGMSNGTSIFRIVKETVTNAAKHARAGVVRVDFAFEAGTIELSIRDDGRWAEGTAEGRGLRNLRQRVQEMGGTFRLETTPATRITCTFHWTTP
jgi:signal transduction histidine kinase